MRGVKGGNGLLRKILTNFCSKVVGYVHLKKLFAGMDSSMKLDQNWMLPIDFVD